MNRFPNLNIIKKKQTATSTLSKNHKEKGINQMVNTMLVKRKVSLLLCE